MAKSADVKFDRAEPSSRPFAFDVDEAPSLFATGVRGQESVRVAPNLTPVLDCSGDKDMARQEYGVQSQIGYQMSRFGVGHPLTFGEVDFDRMDLTTALQVIEDSQQAWLKLPKVLRDRYQSWSNLEAAAASGELEQVLKAAGAAEVSSAAPAASPSDSAAGGASAPS